MYSGTSLTKYSGRVIGAHQKIDRVARRHLAKLLDDDKVFPGSQKILHFEGNKGPDAIKIKSPAKDEPWHYYSPFDDDDSQLIDLIKRHYDELVKQLKKGNGERIAFEAAWLAHALVDGLTPAHHYPYEKTLEDLRGETMHTRTTYREKLFVPGDTRREIMQKNWKVWGPKGLFTVHHLFEFGVAITMAPLSFGDAAPQEHDIKEVLEVGVIEMFKRHAREIAVLDLYNKYYEKGWTPKLAYDVRHKLGPTIVKTVTLAWYSAILDAGLVESPSR